MFKDECPTCHQPWPKRKGRRFCVKCVQPIKRGHHWFTGIHNQPQHYDCNHPYEDPGKPKPAPADMFTSEHTPGHIDCPGCRANRDQVLIEAPAITVVKQ